VKSDKYIALVRKLTEATREQKLNWSPLMPGEYDAFIAALPTRQTFSLRHEEGVYGPEDVDRWCLEVRDPGDELLDKITASPRFGQEDLDAAMGELVAVVEDAVVSRLDDTILALDQLAKALR